MKSKRTSLIQYVKAIANSGLTIYDPVKIEHPKLWIPISALEKILDGKLRKLSVAGLPLRTRSKFIKERICIVLGYPVPTSFRRTKPRFLGQLFDTYIQKSDNLQIWNEELKPTRRYVIIKIDEQDLVAKVKVVTGKDLLIFDTTRTLTQKYQARCNVSEPGAELVDADTRVLDTIVSNRVTISQNSVPTDWPLKGELMSIQLLFEKLKLVLGQRLRIAGADQERIRGSELHKIVCKLLGYKDYKDNGQFPDIPHQLLEIKLQTSPTIDLGLVLPNSTATLDGPLTGYKIRHCDVRYAVFYARLEEGRLLVDNLILVTGEKFFKRFSQFQGKVVNKKLQIPLPVNFFLD